MVKNAVTQSFTTHPAFSDDFPDPFVLRASASDGSQYYTYATNAGARNIQVLRSCDGLTHWECLGVGLPELPAWATSSADLTWAPVVMERGGKYIMFYTCRASDMHVQCISVAASDHPAGPFVDNSLRPLICPAHLGGAIDPSPFIDSDGRTYLLWKNDGNRRRLRTSLWIQELDEAGTGLTGEPVELIHEDQDWEYPLIESPSMVKHNDRFNLFYLANDYQGEDYAIGYAISGSLMGPFVKPGSGPWLSSFGSVRGPGGQEFFTDDNGALWMAYHAWTLPHVGYPTGKRSLYIEQVTFVYGVPGLVRAEPPGPSLS